MLNKLAKLFLLLFASGTIANHLLVGKAVAQVVLSNKEGQTPSGFQRGVGNVNPYNGNLTFTIPLLRIGGRGDAGYVVNHTIVNQWNVHHLINFWSCNINSSPHCNVSHIYSPQRNSSPGEDPSASITGARNTRPGFSPGVMIGKRTAAFDWANLMYQYDYYGMYGIGTRTVPYGNNSMYATGIRDSLTRLSFIGNDGSEVEFRDTLSDGQPQRRQCSEGSFNRGRIFKSVDGSAMTFESDVDLLDWNCSNADPYGFGFPGFNFFNPSGFLKTKNGVVFRIENGLVSWIRDNNGNTISFSGNMVTDSTGKTVTLSANEISFKGMDGSTRPIRILQSELSAVLRSGYLIKSYGDLFGGLAEGTTNGNVTTIFNPVVVSAIEFPDGRRFKFYYNSYGELARVENPNGGAVEYDFAAGNIPVDTSMQEMAGMQGDQLYRRVVEERVYPQGGEGNSYETKITYSRMSRFEVNSSVPVTVETTDAAGNILSKSKHYYFGSPSVSFFRPSVNPSYSAPYHEGREYKTEIFAADGTTVLQRIENQWENRLPIGWWSGYCGSDAVCQSSMPPNDPVIVSTTTHHAENNLVSKKEFLYDDFANQTDILEYEFGTGVPGNFKRRSHTDFVNDANYTSHTGTHLRGLPLQTWVSSDINGSTKTSLTQFEYDNYNADAGHAALVSRSNVVGHDTANYGTNKTIRGNVTKVTSYGNAQNQTEPVSVYSQYDILGNVVKTIDAKGNISTIDYSDRFGLPDGEARSNTPPLQLNGQSTFAFPTSATNPLGFSAYSQFDYFTGQPVNTEDINGVISKSFYNDPLDRPTQTVNAVGTLLEMQSNIIYDDANHRVEMKSDLNSINDNLLKSVSFYDGLGRTIETRRYESDGNFIATKSIPFVMVQDPENGIWRAATKTSNPFRPNSGEQPVWTTSLIDSLARNIKVITPDGAMVKSSYFGNTTTVTDQSGKQRRSVTDALGRLIRVDEPNDTGQLDVSGIPVQPTNYSYDVLGNLTQVQQIGTTAQQCGGATPPPPCTQIRSFVYDSLSRLKSATNPESGLIQYTYDPNGNLITKTDARNITTTYAYDALNRVKTRTYSGEPAGQTTPAVSYFYDGAGLATVPQFAKGKLTKVSSSVSETRYTSFDNLGRVLTSEQRTPFVSTETVATATARNFIYKYNLSGALIEETYPSGRVVKNTLDNDGDLALVQSKRNANFGFVKYAQGFAYTPAGAVASLHLGNGTWESTAFNSRLQPEQIALGNTQAATNLLKLNFDYGLADNNGNVKSQQITVPTVGTTPGFTAVQTYSYDSLNRIKDAKEMISTTQNWKQTFVYDRFGNRQFDTTNGNTTTLLAGCPVAVCNPSANPQNNKLNGTSYDASGNTTLNASNQSYVYDGENKMVQAKDASNVLIGQYWYDGDGKRIKKYVPSTNETTVFVYDAGGKLVAEYSTIVAAPSAAQISYLTNDHLGSPRVITDQNGKVTSRRDFMPFGEEISSPQRNSTIGYAPNNTRQKFTGYERDKETNLDFAQARYYINIQARFSSPDPFGGSLLGPQSLNKYVYVGNNPLNFIDPSGLECAEANRTGDGDQCIWVSNGNGLYESMWQSMFKEGNDLFDKGYQIIDPATVEPFVLRTINNNQANPNNTTNLAALQGELVFLASDGSFGIFDNEVISDEFDLNPITSESGFSIGGTLSLSGAVGIGYIGAAGEISYSDLLFITSSGIREHSYITSGGAVTAFGRTFGVPGQLGDPAIFGALIGGSAGPTFSNATNSAQVEGPFQSVNAALTPGAVTIQASPETWVFSPMASAGPGAGGYGNLTTNTVRLPDITPTAIVINSIPKLPK